MSNASGQRTVFAQQAAEPGVISLELKVMDLTNVDEFEGYLKKELKLATSELTKLQENSRKHLQKLVYTNEENSKARSSTIVKIAKLLSWTI